MFDGFYNPPNSPTNVTKVVYKEIKSHKENSMLTEGELGRKCHRMGFAFMTEGMAETEDCPDGRGNMIKRRIGVMKWKDMLKGLPQPPRDMILDPPTPERQPARGKKARAKEKKARAKKETEEESEDEDDLSEGNTEADIATHLSVIISKKAYNFVMRYIARVRGTMVQLASDDDACDALLSALDMLKNDPQAMITQDQWVNLELAMSVVKVWADKYDNQDTK